MNRRLTAEAAMVLRFTKAEPAAKADSLTCVHGDGRTVSLALPREGVLPRAAIRYVVEATLEWSDGWLAEPVSSAAGKGNAQAKRAVQSEAIAECLQSEQWGGATAPDAFMAKVKAACAKRRVDPPTLSADDVSRLRIKVREFGAAWRPLPPGGVLEFRV